MRIALVVDTYLPGTGAAGLMISDLSRGLHRCGHFVTVITSDSNLKLPWTLERSGGAVVLRIRTGRVKGTGLTRRALNEILMPLQLMLGTHRSGVLADGLDGIVWYSPSIFLAPFIGWMRRRVQARTYLILRDLFPQWAVDVGLLRRGLVHWLFRRVEAYQYRVADIIGVQSPANLPYFTDNPSRKGRVEVLWNWVNLDRPAPASSRFASIHGLAGQRLVVYGGNMGIAQDMENIVRLAMHLKDCKGARFVMVGSGSETGRLRQLAKELALTNMQFLGELQHPDEFRALLRCCHVGLISLDRRLTTHNIPGKLLAYLEAGLPVVASVNPSNDLLSLLAESGAGSAVLNGDDEEFASTVVRILEDAALRSTMSERASQLARRRFDLNLAVQQLTCAFQS